MIESPIQDLVQALDREFAIDPKGPDVARLLGTYASAHDDWRRYANVQPDRYTRNLVRACPSYELIVIAWDGGQASLIHDHSGQRCWMAALEGRLRERLFDNPPPTGGPPVERSDHTLAPGQVAFITDDVALHQIAAVGDPAISLHLYAQPIDTCHVFDPETGASQLRELSYDSTDGQLQPAPA